MADEESDGRISLLDTPTRWPYRIEGIAIGLPWAWWSVELFGPGSLPVLSTLGILTIILMQFGGVTR